MTFEVTTPPWSTAELSELATPSLNPSAEKDEPRVGRDPGFRKKALVAGKGFEPLTFGL